MRIIIITQDEPFYLAENLDYFFSMLPDYAEVVGCVVASASPFGKKESFVDKALKTARIFGIGFFIHYALRFIKAKFDSSKKVHSVLEKYNVPAILIEGSINSEESLDRLRALAPDLLISVLGNQIFKMPLIELAPKGCLNLHTALLPKYRGLMPSFWVLKNQEKETGVSVFFVDKGVDSGPILVQKRIEIGSMTQEQLIQFSKKLGMEAIVEAVDKINNDDVETMENNANDMTYFSFPTHEDVREFRKNGARFY
ncbi:MAG: formyl transferase [Gammaproteobacteria bacterium]|nr:formyl transferase [Gammaproteobacteria bacterium]